MPKKAKNKIVAVFAVLLIVIAVAMAALLLLDEDSANGSDYGYAPNESITQAPTTEYSGLIEVVDSKFLWEYGWHSVAAERPSEIPTTDPDDKNPEETTTVPETYYESVTNWKGEAVTDENGEKVTEIRTHPKTEIYVEAVTDANGNTVTNPNGEPVTEIRSEIVSVTRPPVYVTGADGETVTDADGNAVTQAPVPEQTTFSIPGGAKQWAQGVSDGEKYVRMKIYIDGEYEVRSSSVMSLVLREKSGLINLPDTLAYNLSKGTCSVGSRKYPDSAYVTKNAGQTIVTLVIPEEVRPNVNDTSYFSAKSTISTFNDGNGNYLDEFTVSVDLS